MILPSTAHNEMEYIYLERIYSHGEIEEIAEYDLTCCDETLYERVQQFKEGEETTLVRFEKFKHRDKEYKVVLYLWKGETTNHTMGLVVKYDDIESVQYANEKMKARVDCI